MTRDWQTISRMPAVTDATPDIPFRGKRRLGQRHASSFHGPSGHRRNPPHTHTHTPLAPLSKDHGSDGTSFQRMWEAGGKTNKQSRRMVLVSTFYPDVSSTNVFDWNFCFSFHFDETVYLMSDCNQDFCFATEKTSIHGQVSVICHIHHLSYFK